MIIVISSLAKDSLTSAIIFYHKQNKDIGKKFSDSIKKEINSLKDNYGIHLIVNNYYRALLNKLPFAIYYKVTGNKIIIYDILDTRSNPLQKFNNL